MDPDKIIAKELDRSEALKKLTRFHFQNKLFENIVITVILLSAPWLLVWYSGVPVFDFPFNIFGIGYICYIAYLWALEWDKSVKWAKEKIKEHDPLGLDE